MNENLLPLPSLEHVPRSTLKGQALWVIEFQTLANVAGSLTRSKIIVGSGPQNQGVARGGGETSAKRLFLPVGESSPLGTTTFRKRVVFSHTVIVHKISAVSEMLACEHSDVCAAFVFCRYSNVCRYN